MEKNKNGDAIDDVHPPKFLNTIVAFGILNHNLRLKVGVRDVVKEYRLKSMLMQWYKTNNN